MVMLKKAIYSFMTIVEKHLTIWRRKIVFLDIMNFFSYVYSFSVALHHAQNAKSMKCYLIKDCQKNWGLHLPASLTQVQIFLRANMQIISFSANNQTFHFPNNQTFHFTNNQTFNLLASFWKTFNLKQFLVFV